MKLLAVALVAWSAPASHAVPRDHLEDILAIARTPHKTVDAIFKICHDEQGTVTSRRIVRPSGLAAFDNEALAYWKTIDQVEPVVRGAPGATAPVAVCSMFAFRYPELLAGDRPGGPPPSLPPSSPAPITLPPK